MSEPTSFETIQTTAADGVFTVTLNRPAALNALTVTMGMELTEALSWAQLADEVRCVVLTGNGRAFCAGQDLKDLARPAGTPDADPDVATILRQYYNPVIVRLRTMDKPVLAAINGVAAGAGVSLALAADMRIAASSASLVVAFVHVGLVPDMGATTALIHQVGYARAAEMCFLGESVSAEKALQWGLLNQVVADEELPEVTRQMARRLVASPPRAISLIKRALNHAQLVGLKEQLEFEADLQEIALSTADHQEGLRAFLEKRPPRFSGK
ncbi:MAG: enoyl-CoA hydratase-related protein [Planctomycetota bacterium]